MRTRKFLVPLGVLLGIYLGLTLIVGYYADRDYRFTLIKHLHVIGGNGFAKTDQVTHYIADDPRLQWDRFALKVTPPLGWWLLTRLDGKIERLLYLSKVMAQPHDQRFTGTTDWQRYGIDPSKKDVGDIAGDAFDPLASF